MLGGELEPTSSQKARWVQGRQSRFRLILSLLLLALTLLITVLLSFSGSFLVVNAPKPSNTILVLQGGADGPPYQHALKLQRQGYADKILLDASVGQTIFGNSEVELANEFVKRTWPGLVEVCATEAASTFAEAADAQRCLTTMNVSSVLIVAPDFRTRLALSVFQKRLPQYRWSVAASSAPYHDANEWWKHRRWAKTVVEEWEKLVWWELVDRWKAGVVLR